MRLSRRASSLRRSTARWITARWALATVAPWALGAGLLVSFTASAGQPPERTGSLIERLEPADTSDTDTGPSLIAAASAFDLPALSLDAAIRPARYSYEEPQRLVPMHEWPPRGELKQSAAEVFPLVDRSRKGDPLAASLRPSLSQAPFERDPAALGRLLFESDHGGLSSQFLPEAGTTARAPGTFMPWTGGTTVADASPTDRSPETAAPATPGPSAEAAPRSDERPPGLDGSTPAVSRALALSSTTPAIADLSPVEIAAAPVSVPQASIGPRRGTKTLPGVRMSLRAPESAPVRPSEPRPDYASLVDPDKMDKEQRCLAEAVYFEARSEPEEGQAAVAQVVLNRVKSGLYPDNICGVVYQNRHRYLACQFTFACEGRALKINEPDAWATAVRVASEVLQGRTYLADVGSSTHYHANYVKPWWARRLTRMESIGRHVFYKLKPGQT